MSLDQSLDLKSGTVLQGKYEIIKCLGAGSMGMVYAVKHLELQGRVLAMKVLFSDVAKDEVQFARFRNEIVASYEVNHPNVVRAYDFFREGDLVAYTMEYISGGDLADKLGEDELLPIDQTIEVLEQMVSGLEAIHKAGIIHRDIKPENILIAEDGSIKITDFGIAKNLKGPRLTDHGGIVGTFAYVAPEYLESGSVDVRSDIYSVGVLAYEMITGTAPYSGKNVIDEMHLKLTTDPAPPINLRKECPEQLSRIVMKALSRNPIDRQQSAKDFRISLSKLLNSTKGFTRSYYVKKQDNFKPKVMDSDVARMISGLKNSLEERAYISGHLIHAEELGEADSHRVEPGAFDTYEQYISNEASKGYVSVSNSRLSPQKLEILKTDLSEREYVIDEDDESRGLFEYLGYFMTIAVGIICGLLVINWLSPSSISEALSRLMGLIK